MVIKEVVDFLDDKYPKDLAWDDDLPRIGYILGNKNDELKNVLLTLDVTPEVINEAINNNVNLIISHHPMIFQPIYKIDFDTTIGKMIRLLVLNDISIYAMHTNLDVASNGVGDTLAKYLELNNIEGENKKESYLRYANIDSVKFEDYIGFVKERLGLDGLRYAGDLNKVISSVGILGGSGGRIPDVNLAISKNLDLYISSEFSLSTVQFALNNNLCIIEINHGTEKLVFNSLKEQLKEIVNSNIIISSIETDPFKYF